MSTSLPGKQDVANQLLRKGSLFIHLDPRCTDVIVPPWLRHQSQLVLQVGLDMPIPIPDLKVDSFGIHGTLSFSRSPITCQVPWNSVFALVGDEGRGMVWPESMPAEVVAEVQREEARTRAAKPVATIPPLPETTVSTPPKTPTKLSNGRLVPPWLRVVK